MFRLRYYSVVLLSFMPLSALAYIGPGAGAGAIAVVLGIIASIILAFFAILWYPFKRFLKNQKLKRANKNRETTESDDSGTE